MSAHVHRWVWHVHTPPNNQRGITDMNYTIQDHRDLASHYVAKARKEASPLMRQFYLSDARKHHTLANNMAYFAKR